MNKRNIASIVCFLLVLVAMPVFAGSAQPLYYDSDNGIQYTEDGSTKTMVDTNGNTTIEGNVLSTDAEYIGAPVAHNPAAYYSFMEDWLKNVGYTSNSAVTNWLAITIGQGGKFSDVADQAEWLVTETDGGGDSNFVVSVTDAAGGGWLTLTTTDAAADDVEIQKNGESFATTASKDLWYEVKFESTDVSSNVVWAGMTVSDTDILDSFGNDFFCFYLNATTNVDFQQAKNGIITTNAAITTMVDSTGTFGASAKRFGVFFDGSLSNSYIFVDGVAVATNSNSTTIPNDLALSPAVCIRATEAAANSVYVDYINVRAQR